MKNKPTEANPGRTPDDAPAESGPTLTIDGEPGPSTPERLERAGFERVREYDDLSDLLAAHCETAAHHAHLHPDDLEAKRFANMLRALDIAYREARENERTRARERGERARSLLEKAWGKTGSLAGSAEDYLRFIGEKDLGPTTRAQEADALRGCIARGAGGGSLVKELAEDFVRTLRLCPLIARETCVPVRGAWEGTPEQAKAHEAVARAIERSWGDDPDPEKITRAALRALGYPEKKAKDLFFHRR